MRDVWLFSGSIQTGQLEALYIYLKNLKQVCAFPVYLVYICCWCQCVWSPPKGFVFSRGVGCEHHLQQDPRSGPPTACHLSEPPGCHHHHRGGRSVGHQRVPVSVSLRTLELLCPRWEDGLWARAESRSVQCSPMSCALVPLLCVLICKHNWVLVPMEVKSCKTGDEKEVNKRRTQLLWVTNFYLWVKATLILSLAIALNLKNLF